MGSVREYRANEAIVRADSMDIESTCTFDMCDSDASQTSKETKASSRTIDRRFTDTKYASEMRTERSSRASFAAGNCMVRWPVPGEAVQRLDSQAISIKDDNGQKDAWHLPEDGTAWIVDVDATGDFKLRNYDGVISAWTYRKR